MQDLLSPAVLDVLETYNFEATRQWALDHRDQYLLEVRRGTGDWTLGDQTPESP